MKLKKTGLTLVLIMFVFGLAGCFHHDPVRHLASDAALLVPEKTTKKEVLNFLGEPDEKHNIEGGEVWIYFQSRKSLLRRAPYVGEKIGHEEYDVINVTFAGDKLISCVFRLFSEEEFKRGLKSE